MAIKKVLLQKKIENALYDIFPKSDATIIQYVKGSGQDAVTTDVATELAALATSIGSLRTEIIGELTGNEELPELYDTLKEIGQYLDQHDDSVGALADLLTDVGVASAPAVGDPEDPDYQAPVAASGLHATIEALQAAVSALQAANGTNVSKTKNGAANAGNGELYLDGTLTTIYDDAALVAEIGVEPDATNSVVGSGLKKRIADLEAVEATKVEDGTTNGYLKIDGVDDAVLAYDDSDLVDEIGVEPDAVNSVVGSGLKKRVAELEDRIEVVLTAAADAPTAGTAEDGLLYMVELA